MTRLFTAVALVGLVPLLFALLVVMMVFGLGAGIGYTIAWLSDRARCRLTGWLGTRWRT